MLRAIVQWLGPLKIVRETMLHAPRQGQIRGEYMNKTIGQRATLDQHVLVKITNVRCQREMRDQISTGAAPATILDLVDLLLLEVLRPRVQVVVQAQEEGRWSGIYW